MENYSPTKSLSLLGEVVETFDAGGKRAIKISVESHFIDVLLKENDEVFLGDKVSIEAEISVNSVNHVVPTTRGEPV